MSVVCRLASLFRNLLRRARVEREMDAELRGLVQMLAEENVRAGVSPEAARRATLLAAGVAGGLALAAPAAGLLRDILYGVEPLDPVVYGGVIMVIALVGLTAALVPARRVTRVDPLVALSAE